MIPTTTGALAVALVQVDSIPDPGEFDVAVSLGSSAVGAFLSTLIVGAILVAFAPEYVERMMAAVTEDPIGTFVYGLVVLVFLILVAILLVITIIGILIAIPGIFVASLVWAVGASIGFLAIADRLVGHEDGWLPALVVAAGLNGGLALTGIGGIVSFCVGAAGFGAVMRNWLE